MAMVFRLGTAAIFGAFLLAATTPSLTYAHEDERQFSGKSGDIVNETMSLANEQKYQLALTKLRGLIGETDLSPYERATIYQMIGKYSYELDHIGEAQEAFENALKTGGLLPHEADALKIVIAQLMIGNGQYREGAKRLEAYLNNGGGVKPQYIDLILNAWVQAEDYQRALPWAEKWFDAATSKQRRHYDLMNFLYNNLGQTERQADIIKQMIDRWPDDKNLWDSWVSILASSGREDEAFEVHKLMYQAGFLTKADELRTLVQYYAFYDLPYQAAEILEREIELGRIPETADNLKLLTSYFQQARVPDRAMPYLEKAVSLSNDPKLKIEVAETFAAAGACQKADYAIKTATDQGYDKAKAYMLIGDCYYNKSAKLDRLSCNLSEAQIAATPKSIARLAALDAFNSVPENSTETKTAQKWTEFITAEIAAYERRCHYNWRDYKGLACYQKIKQAYDAAIFTNSFKLEDESCTQFKADYDAEFGRR